MQITSEELESVRSGKTLRLLEGGTDLVVLRADVFDRFRSLLYDDSAWSDEEMDLLAAEDANHLGWEGMEAYQDDKITMSEDRVGKLVGQLSSSQLQQRDGCLKAALGLS